MAKKPMYDEIAILKPFLAFSFFFLLSFSSLSYSFTLNGGFCFVLGGKRRSRRIEEEVCLLVLSSIV